MSYRPMKVVCFGGGTGLPALLSGLKQNPWLHITAVVNMFDTGGSSGELCDRFGILPPGDILKCLLALSKDEHAAREILLKRIHHPSYSGHTGGNILLMALETVYGNYLDAVNALGQLLSIQGTVVPVALDQSTLCATYENGVTHRGEVAVDVGVFDGWCVTDLYLDPKVQASPSALIAIDEADVLCVGPGSFYTSVLPNFLPNGIKERITASCAPIIFNANLLVEGVRGATIGGMVATLEQYMGKKVTFITMDSSQTHEDVLERYAGERKYPVVLDEQDQQDARIVRADLWTDSSIARHDSACLANLVSGLIERVRAV